MPRANQNWVEELDFAIEEWTLNGVRIIEVQQMASTALRQLISERDKLQAEIEALCNKVAGLEIAITLVSDENLQSPATEGR
jgi:hypothetical protein